MSHLKQTKVPRAFLLAVALHALAAGGAMAQEPNCGDRIREVGGPCLAEGVGSRAPRRGSLPRASRQVLGFTLGRDSFAQAAALFGHSTRWESGDAAAGEDKVCYVTGRGDRQVTLVLSAGEMSRGKVDSLRVIGGRTGFSQKCATLPARLVRGISTRSGIRLGMTRKSLEHILGPATEVQGDLVIYLYASEKILNTSDRFCKAGTTATLSSGLTAHFEGDRLAWFDLNYGTGYVC